jgi:ligand-binding sensor domain-containing protein
MINHRFLISLAAAMTFVAVSGSADQQPVPGGSDPQAVHQLKPWNLSTADLPGKYPGDAVGVAVESNGVIWIATSEGAVRYDPAAQSWRIFTVDDGLASSNIASVFVARDGRVILATWAAGISVRDPGSDSFRIIPTADERFVDADLVFEDSAGNIWFSGFASNFYRWAPGGARLEPQRQKGQDGEQVIRDSVQVLEDHDHRLWALTRPSFDGSTFSHFDASDGQWVAADLTSVYQALPKGSPPREAANEPKGPFLSAISADRRNLWLIVNQRLVEFHPASQTAELISIDGLGASAPIALAVDGLDRVWIAVKDGVYYRDTQTGAWHNVTNLKEEYVVLVPDAQNGLWIAGPNTLLRIEPNGMPSTSPVKSPNVYPYITVGRGSDSIAFGLNSGGVYRFDPSQSRWRLLATGARELHGSKVKQLATDADGKLWTEPITTKGPVTRHYDWQRLDPDSGAWINNRTYLGSFDTKVEFQNSRANTWFVSADDVRSVFRFAGSRPDEPEWPLPEELTAISDPGNGIVWGAGREVIQKCLWANRTCESTPVPELARIAPVKIILDGSDGALWLGGKGGVVRYDITSGTATFLPINVPGYDSRPPDKSKGPDEEMVVSTMFLDSNNQLEIGTNYGLFELDVTAPALTVKRDVLTGRIQGIRRDESGNLWVLTSDALVRVDAGPEKYRLSFLATGPQSTSPALADRDVSMSVTLPDNQGAIWFVTERGLSRQGWNAKGFPGRAIEIPFFDNVKDFARVVTLDDGEVGVWQTRPTGLVLRTAQHAATFPRLISYPITSFERAHKGGVWIGHALGGLSIHSPNGDARRISTAEGLPDSSVLSISPIPKREQQAWVATNDGATLVSAEEMGRPVQVVSRPVPGPVDVVEALPDGGAWLAYNTLSRDFFLHPEDAESRQTTRLFRVSADGTQIGQPVELPRGDVLTLATSSNRGEILWVGSTSGLYQLPAGETELIPITAKGTLRASPVRELHVDHETGVVWMGVDAEGPDLSATLIGYNPAGDSVQNFTADRDGLPRARRIDAIDFAPMNKVAALVAGRLVVGQLNVPASRLAIWLTATLAFGLFLGLAGVFFFGWVRKRRVEVGRFRPLLEAAQRFFSLLGRTPQSVDFRTLLVPETGLALAGPSGPVPPSSLEEARRVLVRCAAGDLVPVEEVQATFKAAENAAGSNRVYSYLVYQRELDPAATRQLDVYRLRNNAIIVPLSRPFLIAKLAEGADAARSALDGMKRRYLGEQDLFDVRNALDEPRFFFGRRALIEELSGVLSRGEHAALIGQRKSGKSSLLNLLQQRMNQFPIAKVDMQLYSRTEDVTWPGNLSVRIVEAYDNWGLARYGSNWKVPTIGTPVIDPREFEAALRTRREHQRRLGSDLPLIVLVDEIERVFPRADDHEVQRFVRASGTLRALGQEGGDKLLSLVVADRLPAFNRVNTFAVTADDTNAIAGAETNPFYRFFKEFYLEPLEFDECRDMLCEIGHAMGLDLDDDVVHRIYEDSGGYVSLARQLASAACRHRIGSTQLNMSHYLSGVSWIREQSGEADVFFKENFWDQASAAERRVLYLASAEGGADAADLEVAGPVPVLEDGRLPTSGQAFRSELIDARRMLLATGMLTQRNGKFVVKGDLFREWLQQNILVEASERRV